MSESVAGTVARNTSTIQTILSGRGHGRSASVGGRTQRSAHGRNNRQHDRGNRPHANAPKGNFKGSTADMNGHVFECYEERGDRTQFPRTLEALGEYAAKTLKYPEDLKPIFRDTMLAPTLIEPADLPTGAVKREEVIWEAALKTIARR